MKEVASEETKHVNTLITHYETGIGLFSPSAVQFVPSTGKAVSVSMFTMRGIVDYLVGLN